MNMPMLRVNPNKIQKQNTFPFPVPAPIRGIIAENIYGGDQRGGLEAAILMFNVIPGEYGCRVRPGSSEFATTIPDGSTEIRTLMRYIDGTGTEEVFAATDQGIYDITAGGAGPHTKVVTWGSTGGDAGWCTAINYTNASGSYLLITDEDNGYIYYDGSTWTTSPSVTGVSASNLVHITEWQGRLWFVERDTGSAWFLAALAISGAATELPVGDRFKAGGYLVQNSTWTLDAGDGINDKFVQISSQGDVLVWEGITPTAASEITLVGRWKVASIPAGRRVLTDWGGDVMMITNSGILPISALLSSRSNISPDSYVTKNIGKYFRQQTALSGSQRGWAIELVADEGIAIVNIPQPESTSRAPLQFIVNLETGAWSMFRDLDIVSMYNSNNGFQFGTSDGRVLDLEGGLDYLSLDGSTSDPITYSWLTHYSHFNAPGVWKRPQFFRSYWVGSSPPTFGVTMKYDFDVTELTTTPTSGTISSDVWDTALWDSGIWQDDLTPFNELRGVSGCGFHVAIAVRGESNSSLQYLGAELYGDAGGGV